MRIRLTYMAQLRRALGKTTEEIELPEGATITELLRRLVELRGADVASLLLDPQRNAHPSLLMFREEEQVGPDQALAHNDRVTLLTPMAGG